MISNYIFDFGNVLARFSPREMTEACISDAAAAQVICEAVFDREYWRRLDEGTITDEEVKTAIRRRLPAAWREKACEIYDRWGELLTPMEGMVALVTAIQKQGGNLYLLSNISKGFAQHYAQIPWINALLSRFDGRVFSGPLGITKPNTAIFTYLLERYSLKPETCVFIDDTPVNVAAGERLGIQGYRFDGNVEALKEALTRLPGVYRKDREREE